MTLKGETLSLNSFQTISKKSQKSALYFWGATYDGGKVKDKILYIYQNDDNVLETL